ncbi:hypothetical protein BASA81_000793 [Batrachochytrium salamandrivorans]|nr:hypothetical protein BASA81_000793 [Batrachochytrium salamandrivorans]
MEAKTLLVPAVGLGNVGQLALEYIHSQLGSQSAVEHVDHLGLLSSCVGRTATGLLASSLEFVEVSPTLSLLKVRTPVLPGASRDFAKFVLQFAQKRGFLKVMVVGGASALALTNEHDFYATRQFPRVFTVDHKQQQREEEELGGYIPLSRTQVNQLRLAGLVPFLVEEFEHNQPHVSRLTAMVLFVFEGENTEDGNRLGSEVLRYVQ